MPESPEVLLLDRQSDEHQHNDFTTVERRPDLRLLWLLLAALGTIVLLGAVGALFSGGENDTTGTEPPVAPSSVAPPAAGTETDELDPTGPLEPQAELEGRPPSLGNFGGIPGSELPESVPAFDAPAGLVLVGHSPGGRLAAVRPDGSVTELMAGDGIRFLPLASDGASILGLMNIGGSTLTLDAQGATAAVFADNKDAPAYYPSHTGHGYVVHGTWLGKVAYIDEHGTPIGEGPALARGTVVMGDTDPGLVVRALDGTALLIDRVDGAVLDRLTSTPLAVGGNHQVAVKCDDAAECRVEIQTMQGETTGLLDVDPGLAGRLVASMSPDGRYVAYRFRQQLRVVDLAGAEVALFSAGALEHLLWFEDAIVLADSHSVRLWMPGLAEPAELDLSGAIDTAFRGIAVIRDS